MSTEVIHVDANETVNGIPVDRIEVFKALGLNPRDPKTQALLIICDRYKLDPVLKHVVLISGNAYVTRDGYLAIAHRSGQFDGMEVLEAGETASHYTAKVAVYRKDMSRPFSYLGRYPKTGHIAKAYGPEMAVKVAEVQALRRAFNVTGISAADEMWDQQTDAGASVTPAIGPGSQREVSPRKAPSAPPELADDWDRQSIASRIEALDDEYRAHVAAQWKAAKLPKIGDPGLTKDDVNCALNLLGTVEEEALATYDRRREHVMAKLNEAGVKSDDARHELVKFCTEGRTESTKALTQADVDTIVAYVDKMAADEAAAS